MVEKKGGTQQGRLPIPGEEYAPHGPVSPYSRDAVTRRAHEGGYLSARNIGYTGDLKTLKPYQRVHTSKGDFQVFPVGNEFFFKPAVDL